MVSFEGKLIKAKDSRFGQRVFFIRNGARHWVSSGEWFIQNGVDWPGDVIDVPAETVEAFKPGRMTALRYTDEQRAAFAPADVMGARELLVSGLVGTGLEIGPGSNPMPIPLGCEVIYGDVFSGEVLKANTYDGQDSRDMIEPHIIGTFESLGMFADRSLDFVVACHVIEHTANPIRAIVEGVRKLRKGGSLALVVPDIEKTFDRDRPVTTLEHIVADFVDPSRERDKENFQEFYKLAFPTAPDDYESVWTSKWEKQFPIHFHTWNFESFGRMIAWIQENECSFASVKSHHPVQIAEGIEFYYLITV